MPKKHSKAPRHRDKHSKTHKRHKRDLEKPLEEIDAKKLKIDKNACGDCPEPQTQPDTAKRPKHSKEKAPKADTEKRENKPRPAKPTNEVRHHSLEKAEASFLDKTRLLFRKEKSFNDAVQKSNSALKEDRHRHRSRKIREKVEDPKRKKSHKSPEQPPQVSEGFGRVQEVIFCQMNQPPYKMKNDKTAAEVKDLYRRLRKDERHSPSHTVKKAIQDDHASKMEHRPRHHHAESSKKPLRPSEVLASEQYIAQTQYPDFHCKVKHHKAPDPTRRYDPSLGPYEKYFSFIKPEEGRHQSSGKSGERRHHHLDKEKHRRRSPARANEASQADEQKIHQLIEGDLKNYFGKIQTLIDRKLDALMQLNTCRSKRKKARSHSKAQEEHVEAAKEPLAKEEIIKEVLKRLKEEEQARPKASAGREKLDKNPPVAKELPSAKAIAKRPVKVIEAFVKIPKKPTPKKEELLLRPYTSASSCRSALTTGPQFFPHLYSASEETVRPKHRDGGQRSSSPGRFVAATPKPPHHDGSCQSPEPFLREVFSPPESFRCSANHQRQEFIVQGIEPPILECAKKRIVPVRRLECKTVSIVSIQPRSEVKEATPTSGKSHKTERDLVERKKKSKRFKLYYRYSTAEKVLEDSSEAGSILSDSGRLVSDPSEEKLVMVPLVSKKWNRAATPQNSHLNNIMEEPSDVSTSAPNQEVFVPLTKQYYCRVFTSSHSDYGFKVDKKNAHSNISLQSKETGRFIYYEDGKCRYYKVQKSKSDFKLFPDTHHKHQLLGSRSDVLLDEGRARQAFKTLFLEERRSRKQKPRNYSAFKTVLNEDLVRSSCKECQTEPTTPQSQKQFREIYKTIDCLEKNISTRPAPPVTVDVGVSALKVNDLKEPRNHSRSTTKKRPGKSVDVAIGDTEVERRIDAAVGESEEKLEAKGKPQMKCKSTGVSPIRLAEEAQALNGSSKVQPPQRNPYTPRPRPTKARPPPEKLVTPRVVEAKRIPRSANKVKPPIARAKTSSKGVDAAEQCVKVFRSLEKSSKPGSAFENVGKADPEHQKTQSCFHSYDRRACTTAPLASNVCPVIAAYTCQQPGEAQKVQVVSSTSSSVSDASAAPPAKPVRKSQSLVEVKTSLNDQSRSEMCCSKTAEKEQSFISDVLEKFSNKPRLRCSSKSHGSSLEHYIRDKFTSRLLLTKDYKGGQVSAYQKRKLYDMELRQKMKRNYRYSKEVDVGPQVFEVRFLSMMKKPSKEAVVSEGVEVCVLKEPPKGPKDAMVAVDELEATSEKEEEEPAGQPEPLCQQACACTTQQCKNLLDVMDKLYSTLAQHRGPEKPPPEVEDIFSAPFNQTSSGSDNMVELVTVETAEELPQPVLTQPISCPILTTNSPSFEFLYEETGSVEGDALFGNFVQTFNFNASPDLAAPFLCRSKQPESTSNSIESGYASVKSRSGCSSSLTHFFKKPHIAALFKAPRRSVLKLKETRPSAGEEDSVYEEMTKSCQLYARKVRASGEVRTEESLEEYKEFSLQLLLAGNGSEVLQSKALPSDLESRESAEDLPPKDLVDEDEEFSPGAFNGHCLDIVDEASASVADLPSGCKLVFSNRCFSTQSTAFLGPEMLESSGNSSSTPKVVDSSCGLDSGHLLLAALIKTQEKELAVCANLYQDQAFASSLVASIQQPKKKLRSFSRLFSKKASLKPQSSTAEVFRVPESDRLQSLASNARRCFSMLAEAVMANSNIDNELKICGLLKLLERLESGDFQLLQNESPMDLEQEIRLEVRQAFIKVHEVSAREAKKSKRRLADREMQLIRAFVIKFRVGLLLESDLVAVYIGRGIIRTEDHLKAAVRFLLRTKDVSRSEFEEYVVNLSTD